MLTSVRKRDGSNRYVAAERWYCSESCGLVRADPRVLMRRVVLVCLCERRYVRSMEVGDLRPWRPWTLLGLFLTPVI